ncbi:eCIS core domain-containing protein [Streptomyces phaeofaciens]|uniref:eCIS core domain-containing protein n=1 Tax=Streptomyces phaeofaciens TaxID=68254 RepID=UPI0036B7E803
MRAHRPARNAGSGEVRAAARAASASVRPALPLSPDGLLALQRAAGNAAATRSVQLVRSEERERHEHGPGCGHAQHTAAVQRSAVGDVLSSPGQPLAAALRSEMEARLDADFSDVRLHTGTDARRSAAELGARAYTSGHHVVIGAGGADKHTLAHELTHVIQQRTGPVAGADNGAGLRVSDPGDRDERAAEANAVRVMSGPAPAAPADAAGHPARRPGAGQGPAPVQRMIHQEPSYVASAGGKVSLTNRGDIDVEEHDGEPHVRVYQTVFAPVMAGGGHKDVHQRGDGSIDFRNQQDAAWLNMGRPWRSMHYVRTYQDQKNRSDASGFATPTAQTTTLVRSFLVPLETYRRVTGNAVSEKQIKSVYDPGNLSQSTDKAKDSDQYEIRGAWMTEVVGSAVANSLVTYAPDGLVEEVGQEPRNGTVQPMSALLGRLSMPDFQDFPEYRPAGRQGDGLVLPLDKGKMPKASAQDALIERLVGLLAAAFPKDGITTTRRAKDARTELKRLCGLAGAKDRDVDWAELRDRVRRAMNYAGMPAVLAEVYSEAKDKAAQPDGGGFKVRHFGNG